MKWTAQVITHQKEKRIAVFFEKNPELIARIKQLAGARWSQSKKVWHIPDNDENRIRFKIILPIVKFLSQEVVLEITTFQNYLKSKRYSDNTVKTYSEALRSFLMFFSPTPSSALTNDDVIKYNNDFILANKFSASYQNQIVNSIKLYFASVQDKVMVVDKIHRPRPEHKLPNVLSKEEVKLILEILPNVKHRAMLCLIYSCGLRRSELLHLKPFDIDSKRNLIIIKQSKGKKDRIVPLSPRILELLREYYKSYHPTVWLFEGRIKGSLYSEQSLQSVLKQAVKKVGIKKPVTLHWLRHSYATHLLESGTDLRYIQELLGHNSSRTTEIYTHVSTKNIQHIKSPFDDL
jgi:integrase/recombinase XerD